MFGKIWRWLNTPPKRQHGEARHRSDNWPPLVVNLAGVIFWGVVAVGVIWWLWERLVAFF